MQTDFCHGLPGPDTTLARFVDAAGIELDDLYRSQGWCWTRLRRQAGYERSQPGLCEERLGRGIRRLLHMDDPRRIQELAALLGEAVVPTEGALSEDDTGLKPCAATELSEDRWRLLSAATEVSEDRRRLLTGFLFSLWGTENLPRGVFELLDQISRHEPIREELVQVLGLLEERAAHLSFPIAQELAWTHPVPLSVHSRYALDEVVAAFGRSTVERPYRLREGVMFDAATQSDVFFVTLEKSEARYSPTTMYKDYAISPVLFHQGRSRER